jgi:2-methylcitrate dehydratase
VPERIVRADVQNLLRKVTVRPDEALSKRFPLRCPAVSRSSSRGGGPSVIEKQDYEGFYTRPLSWEKAEAKFERLAAPYTERVAPGHRRAVAHLETKEVEKLTELFGTFSQSKQRKRAIL